MLKINRFHINKIFKSYINIPYKFDKLLKYIFYIFIIISALFYLYYTFLSNTNISTSKSNEKLYIVGNNMKKLYITDCYSCGTIINLCDNDSNKIFGDIIIKSYKINHNHNFEDSSDFNCTEKSLVPTEFYDALKNYKFKSFTFVSDFNSKKLYFASGSIFVHISSCYMCGREFGNMCIMKPNIFLSSFLINKLLNGNFECNKHIPEFYKPIILDHYTKIFIVLNNQKHLIEDCFACSAILNLCDHNNNLKYGIEIYDNGYDNLAFGEPFNCCQHATPMIYKALKNYIFPIPTYITVTGSLDHYFAYKNSFVRIVTCFDCGTSFGTLCKRNPTFSLPECVAKRLDNGIFECHKHIPDHEFLKFSNTFKTFTIVTPIRYLFLANLMASALHQLKLIIVVTIEMPSIFENDLYIIFAATAFTNLPPAEKRILYQLDSYMNKELFTSKYISDLKDSYAVFEYHLENIIALENNYKVHQNVWYLPVGIDLNLPLFNSQKNDNKKWDLLFYGNIDGRRRPILDVLSKNFKINVVTNEVSREELLSLVNNCRFYVNIHYAENEILDLPRIYEILSLGIPVISEDSSDRVLYPELKLPLIHFWEYNNIDSMVNVLKIVLKRPIFDKVFFAKASSEIYTQFMFTLYRGLMGLNIISETNVTMLLSFIPKFQFSDLQPIILSTPESALQRKSFLTGANLHYSTSLGSTIYLIRHTFRANWISTGLSFSLLAKIAIRDELPRFAIAKDNVIFGPRFDSSYKLIHNYLDTLDNQWHIFSGLIPKLNENSTISKAEFFNGILFITLHQMAGFGMFLNIYNANTYETIANWDILNENAIENTLDRKIERIPDFTVITTYPYFVNSPENIISNLDVKSEKNAQENDKNYVLLADKLAEFILKKF